MDGLRALAMEQVIEEAEHGLSVTLGLVSIPGMWLASKEFQCSDHIGVRLPCSCWGCVKPAIERLPRVILVETHCHMPYLRVPKGAINVLPHCAYSGCQRGCPSAVIQAHCPTLGFLTSVLSSLP